MQQIFSLTDDPRQSVSVILEDNTILDILLEFRANVRGWFISISHVDWECNNMRLCNSPNFLKKFKNIINFGLAVTSVDKNDPVFVSDFLNERITLFVLNSDEVQTVEEQFYNG